MMLVNQFLVKWSNPRYKNKPLTQTTPFFILFITITHCFFLLFFFWTKETTCRFWKTIFCMKINKKFQVKISIRPFLFFFCEMITVIFRFKTEIFTFQCLSVSLFFFKSKKQKRKYIFKMHGEKYFSFSFRTKKHALVNLPSW